MKTEDFDYKLDEKSIAQKPLKDRSSRMLLLNPNKGTLDSYFRDLKTLNPEICLEQYELFRQDYSATPNKEENRSASLKAGIKPLGMFGTTCKNK